MSAYGCLPDPPTLDRMTDTCENITFQQLLLWMVNIEMVPSNFFLSNSLRPMAVGCVSSAAVAISGWGVCRLPRGCLPGVFVRLGRLARGCLPRHTLTQACQNITFPQLLLWTVKCIQSNANHPLAESMSYIKSEQM